MTVFATAITGPAAASQAAIDAFSANCFSPFLTAQTAAERLSVPGARVDFYDLRPFSNVAPSPVRTSLTQGTDRRCEVAFDGNWTDRAVHAATAALGREGIKDKAPVPKTYRRTSKTGLLAARFLNPNRIAVVHVGTRPGPNGIETHMTVERLEPLEN